MDTFVARQPIFDLEHDVFGYELLFRSGPDNFFSCADGDHASSKVMSDSMSVHGLDVLTSGCKAFINVTRQVLLDELLTVLPPEQTVIELLETIEPDDEVIGACRKLRQAGYTLALDDYTFEPRSAPLVQEVDIIKVDFAGTTTKQREEFSSRNSKRRFQLLAEKVDTHEDVAEAARLGYSYLQGFFFCKPQMICNREIQGLKLNYLRFLQKINEPDLDLKRLEEILRQDVSLSYKLLKYLNSAAFGLRNKVNSLTHAMSLMGISTLRKWASLVAMSSLADDKPHELLSTCLVRAWFCERVAPELGLAGRESDLFLTGMFSVIDALLDRPIGELLEGMPISDEVRSTLRGERTTLAPAYVLALAMERGKWSDLEAVTAQTGADSAQLMDAYRGGIEWARDICRQAGSSQVRKAG